MNDRQKYTKGHKECKRHEYKQNSQYYFVEYNYSSPEEAFEFFWSLFADERNNFNKIDQEKHKIEQTFFVFGTPWPPDYYVNIDLHHQYGISVSE